MNLDTMNTTQIIDFLIDNLEKRRIELKLSFDDLAGLSGCNAQTYSNFINQKTNIRITTLIQILSALDKLDILLGLEVKEKFSPYQDLDKPKIKRIRKKKEENIQIKWGE